MRQARWRRPMIVLAVLLAAALMLSACSLFGGGQEDVSQGQPDGSGDQQGDGEEEPANADERRVRSLVLLTQPASEARTDFETANVMAENFRQLGLDVEVRPMPFAQQSDVVWYERDRWDMTMWRMVGRPERMDPDELVFNLFHSSTSETGYNFVGYDNEEYDEVAEEQRGETERETRRDLVHQAQEVIAEDQPYVYIAHPMMNYVFNSDVFDPDTVVDATGLGIKNFWTFVEAEPVGEQTNLILNSLTTIDAINPLYIAGEQPSWITELVWDRLMRIGPDGLPQPWAAESVEWEDDTTLRVTIREDMTWHDGEPVTAEDVRFSFTAPQGEEAPMYQPFVAPIGDIQIDDQHTLTFQLTEPNAAFLVSGLSKVNIIPEHIWGPILEDLADSEDNAESIQRDVPIGSGPFEFVHWEKGQEIRLDAYDEHFAAPAIDSWTMRIMPNNEAALGAMTTGELNFLSDYSGDPVALEDLADENDQISVVSSIDVGTRFFSFNLRRPPADDPAFRQALSMAVNKEMIVESVFRGHAVPAESIISPALDVWNNPDITTWGFDIEGARQHLEEAGYEWDSEGNLLYPEGRTEELEAFGS